MKKRLLSILLVLVMCLSLLPATAHASKYFTDYLVSDGAKVIKDFTKEDNGWGVQRCFDGSYFSYTRIFEPSGSAVFKLNMPAEITRMDLCLGIDKLKEWPSIRDYKLLYLNMPTEEFENSSREEKERIIDNTTYWETLCSVTGNTQDFRSHKIDMSKVGSAEIFKFEVITPGFTDNFPIFEIELYGRPEFEAVDPMDHSMPGYQVDWAEDFDRYSQDPLPEGWYFEDKLDVGAFCRYYFINTKEQVNPYVHHGLNAIRFVTKDIYADSWFYTPSFHVGEGYKMTFSAMGGGVFCSRGMTDFRDNTENLQVYAIEEGKDPVALGKPILTQSYYKNYEIDLSAYAGKNIQIAFVHTGPTSIGHGCRGEVGLMLDCFKVWKPQTTSANVIFRIQNGTWDGSDAADKVVTVSMIDGKGILPRNKVPTGMVPNEGYGKGSWLVEPQNCVNGDTVYIYSFAPKAEENPFTDIKESDWFYDPVLWAVDNGITQGIGEGLFGPARSCTRAEVVTFLWRAAKMPEPSSLENPFPDVKESDWFFKPVLWAVESGITVGADGGNFRPGRICNRGEIVTFLWRSEGQPSPDSLSSTFPDVKQTDWFYNPVLWAVDNGITVGADGGNFRPERECTRAEVVTFLYRAKSE